MEHFEERLYSGPYLDGNLHKLAGLRDNKTRSENSPISGLISAPRLAV
jgi:hypothetical protein